MGKILKGLEAGSDFIANNGSNKPLEYVFKKKCVKLPYSKSKLKTGISGAKGKK